MEVQDAIEITDLPSASTRPSNPLLKFLYGLSNVHEQHNDEFNLGRNFYIFQGEI